MKHQQETEGQRERKVSGRCSISTTIAPVRDCLLPSSREILGASEKRIHENPLNICVD
jgi:hypothetical protein